MNLTDLSLEALLARELELCAALHQVRERLKSIEAIILQRTQNRGTMTIRQQQVFDGLLRELCNKEIAVELHIEVRTVKFHITSIFRKFEVRNRSELIVALRRNLTNDSPAYRHLHRRAAAD